MVSKPEACSSWYLGIGLSRRLYTHMTKFMLTYCTLAVPTNMQWPPWLTMVSQSLSPKSGEVSKSKMVFAME